MSEGKKLRPEWMKDQTFTLADPAPWDLSELKQAVDVTDPRSVAACWVWSVCRLVDDYDGGMGMMKYLFADLEPFGRGFIEGGGAGKAGWDSFFNERLRSQNYNWLPRAYFEGASSDNGFMPRRPLRLELYYNSTNTETINSQSLQSLGRLNIVYWVKSHAAGNQVNITLSRFDESDRWYVTSGTSSSGLFYDQSAALSNAGRERLQAAENDTSTPEEHRARYGGGAPGVSRSAPAGVRFCPQCGEKCPAGANFCPRCGTKL
ncbi:MAG: zinc ribbon domain-containing protein [Oscillospiraceae bacterium]|nr:zinc ribbon domain-containing protein [Oscillospiraceae bacterium]